MKQVSGKILRMSKKREQGGGKNCSEGGVGGDGGLDSSSPLNSGMLSSGSSSGSLFEKQRPGDSDGADSERRRQPPCVPLPMGTQAQSASHPPPPPPPPPPPLPPPPPSSSYSSSSSAQHREPAGPSPRPRGGASRRARPRLFSGSPRGPRWRWRQQWRQPPSLAESEAAASRLHRRRTCTQHTGEGGCSGVKKHTPGRLEQRENQSHSLRSTAWI